VDAVIEPAIAEGLIAWLFEIDEVYLNREVREHYDRVVGAAKRELEGADQLLLHLATQSIDVRKVPLSRFIDELNLEQQE